MSEETTVKLIAILLFSPIGWIAMLAIATCIGVAIDIVRGGRNDEVIIRKEEDGERK